MKFVFWHSYTYEFSFKNFHAIPRSGIESTLFGLSRVLARQNHSVIIFARHCRPEDYHNIQIRPSKDIIAYNEQNCFDCFVTFGDLFPLLFPLNCAHRLLYSGYPHISLLLNGLINGPLPDREGNNDHFLLVSLKDIQNRLDKIILKSNWQSEQYQNTFQIPAEKIALIPNGLFPAMFPGNPPERRPRRLIFTGVIGRGLPLLLKLFPDILKQVPDAELVVLAGGEMQRLKNADQQHNYQQAFTVLKEQAKRHNVQFIGPRSRPELIHYLHTASIWVNTNTYPETFCTCLLEAQAAGLAVVASANSIFPEKVPPDQGFLISGDPGSAQYQREFVDRVVFLLQNPQTTRAFGAAARRNKRRTMTWRASADQFLDVVKGLGAGAVLPGMSFGEIARFPMRSHNSKQTIPAPEGFNLRQQLAALQKDRLS